MKKSILLLLLLFTACSTVSVTPSPVSTQQEAQPTQPSIPTSAETSKPDAYSYPIFDPVFQATPYPAPVVTSGSIMIPTSTPTSMVIPTATITQPVPTYPPGLASLRIAYSSGKTLWIWYAGESKLLTKEEEDIYWTPISSDGEVIAYKLSSGLWAINADGTGKRLLVGNDRIQVANPQAPKDKTSLSQFQWIPNTHRLLLNTVVDTEGECCPLDNFDLYMVDADNLSLQTLLPPGKAGANFHISPDGRNVALVFGSGIDLLNLHTREKYNRIQYDPVMVPSEVGGILTPLWSGDSQYLMVVVPPPDIHYGTDLPSKIWKLPVNHQSPQLVSTIGPEFGRITLSPDFLHIATEQQTGVNKRGSQVITLHVANIDGSDDEIYQTELLSFRGWAPDSTHFLFAKQDETLYLGLKGSSPVELPFIAYELRWLDGQTYLYQKGGGETGGIRLGFLDGSSILLVGPASIFNYDFTR